jgi:hypothetical protein
VRRGLLGDLLIREGLINEPQLQQAVLVQKESQPDVPLGQILVLQGAITQAQLARVLERYHKKYRLGDILVETERITEDQLRIALDHQAKTGLRLGDALLQLNFLTEEELNRALCTQFGITFVDLDRLILDRDVAELVDKEYAQKHRVIPIAKGDRVIVLAMDDPSDLRTVAELEAATRSRVNVVTSTHAAFQRAFARVYGEIPEVGLAREYEGLLRRHEALQQEHETLRRTHESLAAQVEAYRQRNEANTATLGELQATHAALRRAHDATSSAQAEAARALAEEGALHAATRERLQALEAVHGRCARDSETTSGSRQFVVEQLETLLDRLKG